MKESGFNDLSPLSGTGEAFNGITMGVISSRADSALLEGISGTLMAVGAVARHLLSPGGLYHHRLSA